MKHIMVIVTEDNSMIIAVADLHLGSQMANRSGFSEFIDEFLEPNQDAISHLILLGDILDLWRYPNSQVLIQNLDLLASLSRLDMEKNYLVGNHDYAIFSLLNQDTIPVTPESEGLFENVSDILDIALDGLKLRFIHGHQIDYWPALSFYEVFSQAMCFVEPGGDELSDVWNIVYHFAESLPEKTKKLVRNLSHETQVALEEKLAGPLEGKLPEEKKGLHYEWDLLRKVSDFEDVAQSYSKSVDEIQALAEGWEQTLKDIDMHQGLSGIPPDLANEVHHRKREVASLTVGLREDEFLIRGHGHQAYINQEAKVADAGCWLGLKGSYVIIENGEASIQDWK